MPVRLSRCYPIGFESFRYQCSACLITLLKHGANINARNRLGRTVLHLAAFHNMVELAEQLIARGVDVMAEDYSGMTALDVCISRDNVDVLELLV